MTDSIKFWLARELVNLLVAGTVLVVALAMFFIEKWRRKSRVKVYRINKAQLEHALNALSIDAKTNTPDYRLADQIFERANQCHPSGDPLR